MEALPQSLHSHFVALKFLQILEQKNKNAKDGYFVILYFIALNFHIIQVFTDAKIYFRNQKPGCLCFL